VEVEDGVATMTQAAFEDRGQVPAEEVARSLRLERELIVGTPRAATTTGVIHLFARVRDRDTLAAIEPDQAAVLQFDHTHGVVAWCEDGSELAQRFFAPQIGIAEDPATGSAAGALAALRVFEGGAPGAVVVRQGAEIGRPSEMRVSVDGAAGAPEPPRVGGRAVPVLDGTLRL
jgi:PhzF family phenazine biosynthesis protein